MSETDSLLSKTTKKTKSSYVDFLWTKAHGGLLEHDQPIFLTQESSWLWGSHKDAQILEILTVYDTNFFGNSGII